LIKKVYQYNCADVHNLQGELEDMEKMDAKIAMMTNHSLFAEGVISRLREYPEQLDLQVFDLSQPDVISHVIEFKPLVVILEENEEQHFNISSFKHIFAMLPNLLIIYLYLDQPDILIIQSERHSANGVGELMDIIRQTRSQSGQFLQKSTPQLQGV
jgi:hypothetical protein